RVGVARGADVDDVDVVTLDGAPPVGLHGVPPELLGCRGGVLRVAADEHGHMWLEREVEESRRPPPALGVGASHERVADHGYAESPSITHSYFSSRGMAGPKTGAVRRRRTPPAHRG